MSIISAINRAIKKKNKRKHPFLFWAIDVHDTIIKSTYDDSRIYKFLPYAIRALQMISADPEMKIILYSCSYQDQMNDLIDHLKTKAIQVDYVNENPECGNSQLADFSKKFYFDILIDDKAGFDRDDWCFIYHYLKGFR